MGFHFVQPLYFLNDLSVLIAGIWNLIKIEWRIMVFESIYGMQLYCLLLLILYYYYYFYYLPSMDEFYFLSFVVLKKRVRIFKIYGIIFSTFEYIFFRYSRVFLFNDGFFFFISSWILRHMWSQELQKSSNKKKNTTSREHKLIKIICVGCKLIRKRNYRKFDINTVTLCG